MGSYSSPQQYACKSSKKYDSIASCSSLTNLKSLLCSANDGSFEQDMLPGCLPESTETSGLLLDSPSTFEGLDFNPLELLDLSKTVTESSHITHSCKSSFNSSSSAPQSSSGLTPEATPFRLKRPGISKNRPRSRQAHPARKAKVSGRKLMKADDALKGLKMHIDAPKSCTEQKHLLLPGCDNVQRHQATKQLTQPQNIDKISKGAFQNKKPPMIGGSPNLSVCPLAQRPENAETENLCAPEETKTTIHKLMDKKGVGHTPNSNRLERPTHEEKQDTEMKGSTLKSHTRRCREKVSRQLENLVRVLSKPSLKYGLKQRGQILDYTIQTLQYLIQKHSEFQAGLALSSLMSFRQWVDQTIAAVAAKMTFGLSKKNIRAKSAAATTKINVQAPLSLILDPFIRLYCVNTHWPYGELWTIDLKSRTATLSASVINTNDVEIRDQLQAFESASRKKSTLSAVLESGPLLRTALSCSGEWIDEYGLRNGQFEKEDISKPYGVKTVQMMPVSLPTLRQCVAVLVFADVQCRSFSVTDMDTLKSYVAILTQRYAQYALNIEKVCFQGPTSMGLAGVVMPNFISLASLHS